MKTGRNDPCPCGSGKKYKKCCMLKNEKKPEDLLWHRLHSMRNDLISKILKFATQTYGAEALHKAWHEFKLYKDIPFDPESLELQIFMPWFFYDWTPDYEETSVHKSAQEYLSPAAELLIKRGNYLDSLERQYIEVCLDSPFSFFNIIECEPGKGFKIKDIFTEKTFDAVEKIGSQKAQVGDILFAKPVTIEGLTTLEACSHFYIPPRHMSDIIELRKRIQINHLPVLPEDLIDYDIELIELYQYLQDILFNPKSPKLCNTDGDSLVLYKIIYDIDSSQGVFDLLHDLNFEETKESLLKNAKYDNDGNLCKIEFSWLKKGNAVNKTWSSTILGYITINKTNLIVDVNSEKRASIVKDEIKKRRIKGIHYKTTVIESIEAAMKNHKPNQKKSKEQSELMKAPEVQEEIAKIMRAHWDNWIFENVPALNDKTPIEASNTKEGREILDSLLIQFERDSIDHPQPGLTPELLMGIRKKLGLWSCSSLDI